jgi:hypothetical protein
MSSDEEIVLAATLRAVEAARRIVGDYADRYAPIRTDQLSALLCGTGCHLEIFPFRSETVAMVLPRCSGVYPIFLNRGAERTDRAFALRHELGHVLAGEAEGPVFLLEGGCMSASERIADLFALADLVPGWWIAWARGLAAREGGSVPGEVAQLVAEFAQAWPAERIVDRTTLRLCLFDAHGV